MSSNIRLTLLAILCVCLFVPAALADTITETCTPVVPNTEAIPYNLTCDVPQFDSTTGILTGVTFQIVSAGGTVLPEQINVNSTSSYTFTNSIATISFTYTGPDSTAVEVDATSSACSGTAPAGETNSSCAVTNFSGLSSGLVSVPAADLSEYEGIGAGTVIISASGQLLSASGNGGPGSAGQLFFGGTGTIGGTLEVTYTYTPEPASMALLGGGLIALASLGRKRRS